MKTKSIIFFVLFIVHSFVSYAGNKQKILSNHISFVENHGKLSVNGVNLVNEKGETVVLKGVSYGWHNWWPRFYNKSTVEHFTNQWNCNVVRAAMGVDPDGGYIQDPEFALDCMTKVIDAIIDEE